MKCKSRMDLTLNRKRFLIEIWVKEQMIHIYDSLHHHHEEFIKIFVGVLEEAGKSTFPGDWEKWETKYTTDNYIRQVDGHSSGVLTSYYAWRLSNNHPLDYWNNEDKVATGAAAKQLRQDLIHARFGQQRGRSIFSLVLRAGQASCRASVEVVS